MKIIRFKDGKHMFVNYEIKPACAGTVLTRPGTVMSRWQTNICMRTVHSLQVSKLLIASKISKFTCHWLKSYLHSSFLLKFGKITTMFNHHVDVLPSKWREHSQSLLQLYTNRRDHHWKRWRDRSLSLFFQKSWHEQKHLFKHQYWNNFEKKYDLSCLRASQTRRVWTRKSHKLSCLQHDMKSVVEFITLTCSSAGIIDVEIALATVNCTAYLRAILHNCTNGIMTATGCCIRDHIDSFRARKNSSALGTEYHVITYTCALTIRSW